MRACACACLGACASACASERACVVRARVHVRARACVSGREERDCQPGEKGGGHNNLPFSALGSDQNNRKKHLKKAKTQETRPPPFMARKWGFGFGPKTGKKHLKKARKAGDPTPPFSTQKRGFGFRPKTNNKHFQKARKEETQFPAFRPEKGGLGSDQKLFRKGALRGTRT